MLSEKFRTLLSKRFPSRGEFFRLVIAVITPLNFWAVLQFFNRVPALILRLSVRDILALLSYVLSASLLETLSVCLGITLLAAILPRNILRKSFLPSAIAMIYVAILGAITFHYLQEIVTILNKIWPAKNFVLRTLSILGCIMFSYAAILLRIPYWVHSRPALSHITNAWVERLEVLSGLFLAIDVLSLGVVILRNLF